MNVTESATAVKSAGIGLALILAAAVAGWLIWKGSKGAAVVAAKISEGAGYLFGATDAPSTIGTDLYDIFNEPINYVDADQQVKTCRAIKAQKGSVSSPTCVQLDMEGKL